MNRPHTIDTPSSYNWGGMSLRTTTERIMIHCTATPEGREVDFDDLWQWHRIDNGWSGPGYHFLIMLNETNRGFADIQICRPPQYQGAGCSGQNRDTLHICYAGGLMNDGSQRAKDTRTNAQEASMIWLIRQLVESVQYPALDEASDIVGHNQFANRACPSFDVPTWVEEIIREGEAGNPEPGDPEIPMHELIAMLQDMQGRIDELERVNRDLAAVYDG